MTATPPSGVLALPWATDPTPLAPALLARYLAFIGEPAATPSLPALAAIQRAHLAAIPFETISPMCDEPIPLDEASLADKLLSGRRGGYCFEHNLLLAGALVALGYDVAVLAGRVAFGATAPRPRTHIALRVQLNARPWLVDVGFGRSAFRAPVALDDAGLQHVAGSTFRISNLDGELLVSVAGDPERIDPTAEWEPQVLLDPRPVHRIDCEQLNLWVHTDDRSMVRQQLIVRLTLPEGRRTIRGGRLRIDEPGRQIDRVIDLDELPQVLREEFGLEPPPGRSLLLQR